MPPVKHALLSASSASRWLVCTAAPRFEEGLPESTSEYAEEGRLAHAIGELKVTKKCTPMSTRTYNTRLNKLKKDPLYTPEMDKTTDLYLEHITEQVMAYDTAPTVAVEVQVDFSDYVPEGFGTCDCCIIGGDLLSIVDYKHGKGVPVSAVGNPQMRLYALGALHRYAPVFGDTIKRVRMTIDQPRLDSYTTDEITVEELRAWGESIKPIAQKAFSGLGEFVPGDHCRFCRGKAQCRARANINTALEDFKDCVPAGSIPADALVPQEHSHTGALTGEEIHPLLSDEEIGALLYTELERLADGLHVSAIIVDPSAASFIEVIRRHDRYRVEKASNSVLDGIRNVATRLQSGDIFFCDCCTDCIREFGMYRWDEKAQMDRPIKENDHSMDDVRYFVHRVYAPDLISFK